MVELVYVSDTVGGSVRLKLATVGVVAGSVVLFLLMFHKILSQIKIMNYDLMCWNRVTEIYIALFASGFFLCEFAWLIFKNDLLVCSSSKMVVIMLKRLGKDKNSAKGREEYGQ